MGTKTERIFDEEVRKLKSMAIPYERQLQAKLEYVRRQMVTQSWLEKLNTMGFGEIAFIKKEE